MVIPMILFHRRHLTQRYDQNGQNRHVPKYDFQTSSIEREKISAELTELNKRYSMESQSRYFSCSDFFDGNLSEFSRDDVIRSSLSSRNGKRNGPKEMILSL